MGIPVNHMFSTLLEAHHILKEPSSSSLLAEASYSFFIYEMIFSKFIEVF